MVHDKKKPIFSVDSVSRVLETKPKAKSLWLKADLFVRQRINRIFLRRLECRINRAQHGPAYRDYGSIEGPLPGDRHHAQSRKLVYQTDLANGADHITHQNS